MSTNPNHPQYLLAAAADHEILEQAIAKFRKLYLNKRTVNAEEELAALRQLLTHKLPSHFSYEEQLVFPELLAEKSAVQVAKTVTELCDDHVRMLLEAQRLNSLITLHTVANCEGELWTALLDFFEDLQKHTVKEDVLFGSLARKAKR